MEEAHCEGSVPLAVLLRREISWEKIDTPDVIHGQANESKKGEDFIFIKTNLQRVLENGTTTFSAFSLFDGHNGPAAAIYSKENLLNNVLDAVPPHLSRSEWIQALPRALVAGFVKTDMDFKKVEHKSGTTATLVIIDGWIVTVASVGDSRCLLESAKGSVYTLSTDHRLEVNDEEVERVIASGREVGRINTAGAELYFFKVNCKSGTVNIFLDHYSVSTDQDIFQFGPLRCWPGGLCLSRSIGDMDVGEFIVPVPHVKQIKLSNAGGRILIASDGVWDALSSEKAFTSCCSLPAEAAAVKIVKEVVQYKGLRDDTTCIVVDIIPVEKISPSVPPQKRQGKNVFMNKFRKRSSESLLFPENECFEADMVEEIFEDGSATLATRLDTRNAICNKFKAYRCAVCQLEMRPGEGISVHDVSSKSGIIHPWDGPFLCSYCQSKKEAMEGRKKKFSLEIP